MKKLTHKDPLMNEDLADSLDAIKDHRTSQLLIIRGKLTGGAFYQAPEVLLTQIIIVLPTIARWQ